MQRGPFLRTTPMPLVRTSAPGALVKEVDYVLPATTEQEQAFSIRYTMLCPRLIKYAARFLGQEGGEDAVHEAVTDIWRRKPLAAFEDGWIPFFYASVKNQIALARRREYRQRVLLGDYFYDWSHRVDRQSAPDVALEEAEKTAVIEATVALMPERCRLAWTLVRESELTYGQAAEALGITLSGAKQLMTRAQAMLRERLVKAGYRLSEHIFPRRSRGSPRMLPQNVEEAAHE